ncbi:MAG: carboxymuconolactone decarboxylase family protein [bacterium]
MDEKTNTLICLGAAAAANCVPCFEHFLARARAMKLAEEEISEAADLARKILNGAHVYLWRSIESAMGREPQPAPACFETSAGKC